MYTHLALTKDVLSSSYSTVSSRPSALPEVSHKGHPSAGLVPTAAAGPGVTPPSKLCAATHHPVLPTSHSPHVRTSPDCAKYCRGLYAIVGLEMPVPRSVLSPF